LGMAVQIPTDLFLHSPFPIPNSPLNSYKTGIEKSDLMQKKPGKGVFHANMQLLTFGLAIFYCVSGKGHV